MTNDFLEPAKDSSDDNSGKRYRKLKKEKAGTEDKDMAKKRYEELKEKAKKEFAEEQRKKEQQEENEDKSSDNDGFVTY